jgi:hypothetical protein
VQGIQKGYDTVSFFLFSLSIFCKDTPETNNREDAFCFFGEFFHYIPAGLLASPPMAMLLSSIRCFAEGDIHMGKNSKYRIPAILAAVDICIACACCSVAISYFCGDTLPGSTGITIPGIPQSNVPSDTTSLPEWTIIAYADADDDVLEQDIWFDINEMELVGSTQQMNIVVQPVKTNKENPSKKTSEQKIRSLFISSKPPV